MGVLIQASSGDQAPSRGRPKKTGREGLAGLLLFFLTGFPLTLTAAEPGCPEIASAPPVALHASSTPWPGIAEPYLSRYAQTQGAEPNYGVGYLALLNTAAFYYDWPRHLQLPLWSSPNEQAFYGWLQSGQVYSLQSADSFALTGAGLVETDYEQSSFIVSQLAGDWLEIRLKPGPGGLAWTHRCHLQLGQAKLTYRSWEHFLGEHGDWLHFRSQVPHSLRTLPDIHSPRVTMIGLNHKLILHEIRGDWMRVTVQQPDMTCSGQAEKDFSGLSHEGWVKWRDEQQGPWVWVYTRGC